MERDELKIGMWVRYNGKAAKVESKERTCIYVRLNGKLKRVQARSLTPEIED